MNKHLTQAQRDYEALPDCPHDRIGSKCRGNKDLSPSECADCLLREIRTELIDKNFAGAAFYLDQLANVIKTLKEKKA